MCLNKLFKSKDKTSQPSDVMNENINNIKPIKILIDNGHGAETLGKRSPYSCCGVEPCIEFYEWEWNREIARHIVDHLKTSGFDAELLVEETYDVSLKERVNRVNSFCNYLGKDNVILISIHSNAAGDGTKWCNARGWSVYTSIGETKSDKLANYLYAEAEKEFINHSLKIRTDMQDGDKDYESNLYICKNTKCVAVLSENFFFDNIDDVQYILSDEGKSSIIKIHVDGIIKYITENY